MYFNIIENYKLSCTIQSSAQKSSVIFLSHIVKFQIDVVRDDFNTQNTITAVWQLHAIIFLIHFFYKFYIYTILYIILKSFL